MKIYEWNKSRFPIMSLSFDLIWFVVDILLIYFIISRAQHYMTKVKNDKTKVKAIDLIDNQSSEV